MDVLGHEDVAEDVELMPRAQLFEYFKERDSRRVAIEEGKPVVAGERDEVVVA